MTEREVTKEQFETFVALQPPGVRGQLDTIAQPPVFVYSTPNTWEGPFERRGHIVAFIRCPLWSSGDVERYFIVEETDDQLRERLLPTERRPDMLQIVLGCALACERPPTSLRGETVGPGHVRIYAGGDPATLAAIERRCAGQLTAAWRVDVLPELA